MIRNAAGVLCLLLVAGCYTQFAYVRSNADSDVPPDSAYAADGSGAYLRDTVPANPNQVCYWTRDILGRPELVCDDADYGRDWYRYSEYPWWNRSDPYFYGSYNSSGWDQRCPAYYYYDNSCGECRYYSGYGGGDHGTWWWNSSGRDRRVIPRRQANSFATATDERREFPPHRSGRAGKPFLSPNLQPVPHLPPPA